MNLEISEIYKTIQGESNFAGYPCVIIRFTGCNLRCVYCDTKDAYENGIILSMEEICKRALDFNCNQILLTGGEPMLQKNIYPLTELFLEKKKIVLMETNGSIDLGSLSKKIIKILDIKCPGSNMSNEVYWKNIKYLKDSDEIKFVIICQEDYIWAKEIILKYSLDKICTVTFSPVVNKISPKLLAGLLINDNLNIRIQLQLHKIIGCK